MTTLKPVPAKGKVTRVRDGGVVFNPTNSNYELYLTSEPYQGPVNVNVEVVIRVTARKIYTVPSGGNFIAPILGTPRTIQGMVRDLDEHSMIVQAGTPVLVEFPADDSAFELASGPITIGSMVNVVANPGAGAEFR